MSKPTTIIPSAIVRLLAGQDAKPIQVRVDENEYRLCAITRTRLVSLAFIRSTPYPGIPVIETAWRLSSTIAQWAQVTAI